MELFWTRCHARDDHTKREVEFMARPPYIRIESVLDVFSTDWYDRIGPEMNTECTLGEFHVKCNEFEVNFVQSLFV
jgi:hypothetical protein